MTTTTASPIHDLAVATDTVIAEINTKIAKERSHAAEAARRIDLAERANAKADAEDGWKDNWHGISIAREQYRIAKCAEKIAELEAEAAPFHAVYRQHRWSRFFLVLNTNGHIHRDTSCSTCFITTDFGWLPELSGLTEADAVEQQGEILCSVCFPSAPVEWTNGTSNTDKAAKAERAALKAERLAKKTAKALVPDDIDGGLVINTGSSYRDRIKTIAAAKTWLTDSVSWNSGYPMAMRDGEVQKNDDGTVRMHHPSYPPEAVALVAETLAARIGSTPEAEMEAAHKRYLKRR